jgi:hypothetical protein
VTLTLASPIIRPRKHHGVAVVCLSYPGLPPFQTIKAAAAWANTTPGNIIFAIRNNWQAGKDNHGNRLRWRYLDRPMTSRRGINRGPREVTVTRTAMDGTYRIFPSIKVAVAETGLSRRQVEWAMKTGRRGDGSLWTKEMA